MSPFSWPPLLIVTMPGSTVSDALLDVAANALVHVPSSIVNVRTSAKMDRWIFFILLFSFSKNVNC